MGAQFWCTARAVRKTEGAQETSAVQKTRIPNPSFFCVPGRESALAKPMRTCIGKTAIHRSKQLLPTTKTVVTTGHSSNISNHVAIQASEVSSDVY